MTRFTTTYERPRAQETPKDPTRLAQQKAPHDPTRLAKQSALHDPTRWAGILGLAVLVLTLVPLLLISRYNHSYADDWHYGVWAHLALEDGANFFQLIGVAFEQSVKAWFEWQGTYSAIFLMALEPSVWGEQFYVLAAPLVLATLVAGTFFFGHVFLVERMGAPRGIWLGLCSLLVSLQLLLQPSPVEGIFWFNSAVYYTTYNAAALAMLGCAGRICDPNRTRPPRGVMVAYCLLAVFVAGGNFVTALVLVEVMAVVMVVLWRSGRRCMVETFIGFSLLLIGLVFSLVAPGNSVRQATQFPDDNAGVVGTIVSSSLACFQYIQEWSTGFVLLLAVAALAAALYVCPRAIEKGLTFKYPAWVVVGTIALFATSFTPTFWAESSVGPGRVQNCRFDIFLVLIVFDIFWVVGWLETRRLQPDSASSIQETAPNSMDIPVSATAPSSAAVSATAAAPVPAPAPLASSVPTALTSTQSIVPTIGEDAAFTSASIPASISAQNSALNSPSTSAFIPLQDAPSLAGDASFVSTPAGSPAAAPAVEPGFALEARQQTTPASLLTARHFNICFGLVILVFFCIVGTMAADETLSETLSSISAANSLLTGKAQAYHEQVLDRLDYIETSTESTLEVTFYHDIPHVLWMGDIRDNMDNYINYRLCQWYGKESIIGVSSTKSAAVGVTDD